MGYPVHDGREGADADRLHRVRLHVPPAVPDQPSEPHHSEACTYRGEVSELDKVHRENEDQVLARLGGVQIQSNQLKCILDICSRGCENSEIAKEIKPIMDTVQAMILAIIYLHQLSPHLHS